MLSLILEGYGVLYVYINMFLILRGYHVQSWILEGYRVVSVIVEGYYKMPFVLQEYRESRTPRIWGGFG